VHHETATASVASLGTPSTSIPVLALTAAATSSLVALPLPTICFLMDVVESLWIFGYPRDGFSSRNSSKKPIMTAVFDP